MGGKGAGAVGVGGADEFARAVVKKSVAKVCVELGYSSIQETALHAMMDLLTRFLRRFGVLMRVSAEDYCSRSYNQVDDALYALDQMGISIDDIFSCIREFNPGSLHEDIAMFPIPLHLTQTHSKEPAFNPSVDSQPPPSFYHQISLTKQQESKSDAAEVKNKAAVTSSPVKTRESNSVDESCPNNANSLTSKHTSQPTFLHINPTLASSSGMLPASVTLQYDEERGVPESQMGGTPKKVALLKHNLLKKPNDQSEPMLESFSGTCSRKLRLGNDAGVNSPLKDDGVEKSPATGKEKQGNEIDDQSNVAKGASSHSYSSAEVEKQPPKKQQHKESSSDHVDAAPLVKTLPIPPANAKAASAIDHETETEKVVEHRGMVIKTIKKDNALPVLQFPSLPKPNKDTKRKTAAAAAAAAKKREAETSVKLQINIGSKLAVRQRNKSGTPKQSQPKHSTVASSKEVVEPAETMSSVGDLSGVKAEPEDASNISVPNTDSDYDNTEANSSRELEPSEDASLETTLSTMAQPESAPQPEPIDVYLRHTCGSSKQEFPDESALDKNEQPSKIDSMSPSVQESAADVKVEPIDLPLWNPQQGAESVDTASDMFDDAFASPPDKQTRIFGNINTPISIPETPEIGSTPMGFCIAAASAGDATNSSSTHTVFARIFNSPPRIKSEPGEIATAAEANDEIERPLTPLSEEGETTFEAAVAPRVRESSQVTQPLNVHVEDVKEEVDYVDAGDETDAESDANKLFSPWATFAASASLDGNNSSPRANSDCLDTLTSDNTLIDEVGANPVDAHTFGPPVCISAADHRNRPGNILAELINSAANDDDDEIEVPPSPDLPPLTPSTSNEIPRSPILDDDLNSGPNSVDRSSPTSIVAQCQPPIFLHQRQSVIVCNPATTSHQLIVHSSTALMRGVEVGGIIGYEPDDVSSTTQPALPLHYQSGTTPAREAKRESFTAPESPECELFEPPAEEGNEEGDAATAPPLQNPEVSCASEEWYFSQQRQLTSSAILRQTQTTSTSMYKSSSGTHSHKSSKEKDRSWGHGRKRKHSSEHKSKKKHKKMKREYVEVEENSRGSFIMDEEKPRRRSGAAAFGAEEGDDEALNVLGEGSLFQQEEEDDEEMPMLKLTLKFGGKSVTIGRADSLLDNEKPLHVRTMTESSPSEMAPNSPLALDSSGANATESREEPSKKSSGSNISGKRGKDDSMKDLLQKAELMQTDFSATSAKSSSNQSSANGGGSHSQSTADLMSPITPVGIREIDFTNTSPNLPPLQGTAPTSCYKAAISEYGNQQGIMNVPPGGTGVHSAFTYQAHDSSATDNQEWICPACSQPDNGTSPMIGCDRCDAWYHWQCLGIVTEPSSEQWFCPKCVLQQATTHKSSKGGSSSNGGSKKKSSKKASSGSSKRK